MATGFFGLALVLTFVIPTAPRISYYAAPLMTTYAAFIKESRMKFADPTQLDRKSGVVELQFSQLRRSGEGLTPTGRDGACVQHTESDP
jgi:hypothetical protein